MGLSIHYSGNLKNANLLTNLIEEVQDVAKAHGWKYHIFETFFPNNKFDVKSGFDEIYGISFTPTDCETISITFLANGVMVCPSTMYFFTNSITKQKREFIYTISVKTQYAGVKVHQFIILFFKYLEGKYFSNFKLFDESGYWETNDEEKMKTQFENYTALLDNFALAMETFPVQKDENIIVYFERLMKQITDLEIVKFHCSFFCVVYCSVIQVVVL